MHPTTPELTVNPTDSTRAPTCFVRVTGEQAGRFVEFEFAVGDPELSIEMILPFHAFDEFCERH
jgi:phenol hydroxylase P0 protein